MATRKKSIKVPVNFGAIANIADNTLTTLGTPTIYVPENGVSTPVTFSAAMLYVAQQSSGSTSQTITSPSATLTLAGAGSSTTTITGTSGQTGEDISGIIGPINFTNYFTGSFGTDPSKACTVAVTFDVSAGATVGAYAWLDLTYTYDDVAAKKMQTICIPYESSTTTLPTTATTYATLEQLTGTGGILSGYATPSIRHRWIEIKGNTNLGTTGTDISMSFSYDGGAGTALPIKENGGAFGNWVYYQIDASSLTTDATHTLQLWNSLASRWANIVVNEWVSFEYTSSGTTSCLNYIELPVEFSYPLPTVQASASIFSRTLNLQEPTNISLVKGAVEIQYNAPASVTMQIQAGSQASFRGYVQASDAVAGQFTFNHGLDADSASGNAFTLARGDNPIDISLYASTGTPSNVTGILRLLYSSSIAPSGIDSHAHTFYSLNRQMDFTTFTDTSIQDSVQIPETSYWLMESAMAYNIYAAATNMSILVQAQLLPGEGIGEGFRELYLDSYVADGEYSYGGMVIRNRPEFKRYPEDPDTARMNLESSRLYNTRFTTATRFGNTFFTTYHTITSSISGNITNSGGGTVNIDLYQLSGSLPTLFDQTTQSGDGSYSFVVYDDTKTYYVAAYASDTLKGLSKQDPPGTGFDISLSAAGGGEFYF